MNTEFGSTLKQWRQQRRMSQLELGLSANVSARHISFLETGRSRPSRGMVLQLCEELAVPLPARNQLLTAAGLAPAYQKRSLDTADMQPAREALSWMMQRHDPFPAIAMDRHWHILQLNEAATRLLSGMGLGEGDSLLEAFLSSPEIQQSVENLSEVAFHVRARLQTESAHLGGDPVLSDAAERLTALIDDDPTANQGVLPAFVPTTYAFGGMSLSFFSTFSQFGTAEDIALAEIKIEMMFPADDATRDVLMAMGNQH
ncbi:MAG: helix-turn-helix transcriptional regulator [Rhizobiaceae bacterium]